MKKLINPTTHFFAQAEKNQGDPNPQIQNFVKTLINKKQCQLCKKDYDTDSHIPRILIHCGHTFCSSCLIRFYTNRRVRCPMCLKLIKYFDTIERIPINHTIYSELIHKQNKQNEKEGKTTKKKDPSKLLFSEFERVQKEAHKLENPQRIDRDSGLPFCVFHGDRVEHFYCKAHQSSGCRVCIQIGHGNADCEVIDLYNEDDPFQYMNMNLEQRIDPAYMGQFNGAGNANGQQMLYFDQGQNIQNSQINYIENFLEDNSDEDNLGAA